jgi:hypothetical protein
VLLLFPQIGVGVAEDLGFLFLGDEGQETFLAARTLGNVMLLQERSSPGKGMGWKSRLNETPRSSPSLPTSSNHRFIRFGEEEGGTLQLSGEGNKGT